MLITLRIHTSLITLTAIMTLLSLTACGQKGPLVPPQHNATASPAITIPTARIG